MNLGNENPYVCSIKNYVAGRGHVGNWAAGTIQQPRWKRGLKGIVKRVSWLTFLIASLQQKKAAMVHIASFTIKKKNPPISS